ncbi:hypothetical protein [Streptoalloteichus hindustanus]|uniref:Uncharacterized protein n=1 Tax=Streptoalloteichus hindustanus TaxID=2017 RepID=A0A1M5F7L0_STRHI|nr:hypothetical protein [Streptoalloteichus hindustanus]SHF87487.1 hypothetical protein SAMN05444320_105308 [Streptoalloteichus hindustanus]
MTGKRGAESLLIPGVATASTDSELCAHWLAVVHQVARETESRVLGQPTAPGPARNYYEIRVQLGDSDVIRLLLNVPTALVAAADDRAPGELATAFRPVPRGDLFRHAGLRVAEPSELERPLTHSQTRALSPAERQDIAYHRPDRVGDVVFNWFD